MEAEFFGVVPAHQIQEKLPQRMRFRDHLGLSPRLRP